VPATQQKCLNCRHFRNDPRYLETVFKGMNILGSGYASVRKNDGICEVRDQYLSADFWCDRHLPFDEAAAGD
jgi:hypothetical protein